MSRAGDAAQLAAALQALAGEVVVEGRDRLAVIRPTLAGYEDVIRHRDAVVAAARQHGFTHVCVELT
ncbi:MAG: hypothetical protein IPK85_15560 [Gemmatimonadetes bacterium]|nr:hypothetical protein [Gemmatimonadota bacterium]